MVAFKEEFPYLRTTSGQLFEFNRDWLHAALTRAANEAGYPGWWLTEHVTESIAFYLHLRNDENVVAFNQLSQTVRDVLEAIGYKEICRYFTPAPPPISISLVEIAYCAGAGYELAFFGLLEKRIDALIEAGADNLRLSSLQLCVKHLRGTKTWTRACDALRRSPILCRIRFSSLFPVLLPRGKRVRAESGYNFAPCASLQTLPSSSWPCCTSAS